MRILKFWTRCDYCGTMAFVTFGWICKENKDYCCQACANGETKVLRTNVMKD